MWLLPRRWVVCGGKDVRTKYVVHVRIVSSPLLFRLALGEFNDPSKLLVLLVVVVLLFTPGSVLTISKCGRCSQWLLAVCSCSSSLVLLVRN